MRTIVRLAGYLLVILSVFAASEGTWLLFGLCLIGGLMLIAFATFGGGSSGRGSSFWDSPFGGDGGSDSGGGGGCGGGGGD